MPTPDVALIAPYPHHGSRHTGSSGVASYAANLAHALHDAGASVSVIAPHEAGQRDDDVDGGVEVRRRFDRGAAALPAALAAARATGAPVVHVQHETFLYGGPAAIPGMLAATARAAPVVTLHQVVDPAEVDTSYTRLHRVGVPAPLARAAVRGVQATIRRFASATIVHEPSFARLVPGAVVIPHGVERRATPDRDAARAALGLAGGRLVVLCFGFLAPYKGLEVALEAAELAGDAVLLVVAGGDHPRLAGRDPYAGAIRQRYEQVARFTGWVAEEDVARWFAAADLALFAYPRPFSSSGALALALAHGTPALLSEPLAACVGAPPSVAVAAEPIPLAARLLALADDRRLLDVMARDIRDMAVAHAWPAVARRHLDLYEEVTNGQRGPRRRLRAGQPG